LHFRNGQCFQRWTCSDSLILLSQIGGSVAGAIRFGVEKKPKANNSRFSAARQVAGRWSMKAGHPSYRHRDARGSIARVPRRPVLASDSLPRPFDRRALSWLPNGEQRGKSYCLVVWSRNVAFDTITARSLSERMVWVARIAVRMPLCPATSTRLPTSRNLRV